MPHQKQKHKILFYSDCPIFGGSEKVLVNLTHSQELNKEYDLIFAYRCHKKYHNDAQREIFSGLKKFPLFLLPPYIFDETENQKSKILKILYKFINRVYKITHIYVIYDFFYIYTFLKRVKPDIIYINNGGYPGAYTCRFFVLVCRLAGFNNVIFHVNNLAFPVRNKMQQIFDKIFEKNIKFFITCSKAAKKQLNLKRKFPLQKILDVPNTICDQKSYETIQSVLRDDLDIDKSVIIVGSVGQLIERKGYQVLIESINILNSKDFFLGRNVIYHGVNYIPFLPSKNNIDLINKEVIPPLDGSYEDIPVAKSEDELRTILKNKDGVNPSILKKFFKIPFDISFINKLL